jgi:hypothetical protein
VRVPRLPAGWQVLREITVPDAQSIDCTAMVIFSDGWTLERIKADKPMRANKRRGVDGIIQIRMTIFGHCRIVSTRGVRWTATFTKTTEGREHVSSLSNYRPGHMATTEKPRCNGLGSGGFVWGS